MSASSFRPLVFVSVWIFCLLDITQCKSVTCDDCDKELLFLISFDGFRWDYLNRGITPNLNKFAAQGGRANHIVNPFPTKTLPSHFTTVTGLYEESHGIVGNRMYDPILNKTFNKDNTDTEWWSQRGQEPVWITNQRQGGKSAVIDYPGMDVTFGGMRPYYEYSHFNTSVSFDERIDQILALFVDGSINFAALYLEEPDWTGHAHGPDSVEMNETIRLCDRTVKHLVTRLRQDELYDKVNVIIASDHGMASVDKSRIIYAEDYLNDTLYPHFTTEDDPVVGIWPRNNSHTLPLYESLKTAPHITVYLKDDIPPEYHYHDNVRIAPILAVADEGWILVAKDWDPWHLLYKGNHGFNNSLTNMHGFFVAHGPSFKKGGYVQSFPSVDIYPLMCHLLDITPNPNNGTMTTVRKLLVNPYTTILLYALVGVLSLLLIAFIIWLIIRKLRNRNSSVYLPITG